MNKMNRKVEYALMALKYMSSKYAGQKSTVREISTAVGSPNELTARVLQKLTQSGILSSEQGSQGGYMIARDLSRVSLHELIEKLTGPTGIVKCLHSMEGCDLIGQCNIQSPLGNLNKRLVDFYKSLSLSEILNSKETGPFQKHGENLGTGVQSER